MVRNYYCRVVYIVELQSNTILNAAYALINYLFHLKNHKIQSIRIKTVSLEKFKGKYQQNARMNFQKKQNQITA